MAGVDETVKHFLENSAVDFAELEKRISAQPAIVEFSQEMVGQEKTQQEPLKSEQPPVVEASCQEQATAPKTPQAAPQGLLLEQLATVFREGRAELAATSGANWAMSGKSIAEMREAQEIYMQEMTADHQSRAANLNLSLQANLSISQRFAGKDLHGMITPTPLELIPPPDSVDSEQKAKTNFLNHQEAFAKHKGEIAISLSVMKEQSLGWLRDLNMASLRALQRAGVINSSDVILDLREDTKSDNDFLQTWNAAIAYSADKLEAMNQAALLGAIRLQSIQDSISLHSADKLETVNQALSEKSIRVFNNIESYIEAVQAEKLRATWSNRWSNSKLRFLLPEIRNGLYRNWNYCTEKATTYLSNRQTQTALGVTACVLAATISVTAWSNKLSKQQAATESQQDSVEEVASATDATQLGQIQSWSAENEAITVKEAFLLGVSPWFVGGFPQRADESSLIAEADETVNPVVTTTTSIPPQEEIEIYPKSIPPEEATVVDAPQEETKTHPEVDVMSAEDLVYAHVEQQYMQEKIQTRPRQPEINQDIVQQQLPVEENATLPDVKPYRSGAPAGSRKARAEKRCSHNLTNQHKQWMRDAGIPESDWPFVSLIVACESRWDYKAKNKRSSATGLCQTMLGLHEVPADFKTNPVTQLKWCHNYAQSRYKGWSKAWDAWVEKGWW